MDTDEGEGGDGWSSNDERPGLDQLAFTKTCGYLPTREDLGSFLDDLRAMEARRAEQTPEATAPNQGNVSPVVEQTPEATAPNQGNVSPVVEQTPETSPNQQGDERPASMPGETTRMQSLPARRSARWLARRSARVERSILAVIMDSDAVAMPDAEIQRALPMGTGKGERMKAYDSLVKRSLIVPVPDMKDPLTLDTWYTRPCLTRCSKRVPYSGALTTRPRGLG